MVSRSKQTLESNVRSVLESLQNGLNDDQQRIMAAGEEKIAQKEHELMFAVFRRFIPLGPSANGK